MTKKHTPGPWVALYPEVRRFHNGSDITHYDIMSEKTRLQLREEGHDHYERSDEDVANVSIVSCTFWRDMRDDEAKANARLIAAAPDLLEALHTLCTLDPKDSSTEWNVAFNNGVVAIAKASGSAT